MQRYNVRLSRVCDQRWWSLVRTSSIEQTSADMRLPLISPSASPRPSLRHTFFAAFERDQMFTRLRGKRDAFELLRG
jgi:hypothetical protein